MGEQCWPEKGVAGGSYSTSRAVSVIARYMGMFPTKGMSSWGHCGMCRMLLGPCVKMGILAQPWPHATFKVVSIGLGTDGVAVMPTVPRREQRSQADSRCRLLMPRCCLGPHTSGSHILCRVHQGKALDQDLGGLFWA